MHRRPACVPTAQPGGSGDCGGSDRATLAAVDPITLGSASSQATPEALACTGDVASPCGLDLDAPDASNPLTSSDHPPEPGAAPSPSTADQPCHWADHGEAGQVEAEEDLHDVAEAAGGGPAQCKELLAAFAGPDPSAESGEEEAPLDGDEEEEAGGEREESEGGADDSVAAGMEDCAARSGGRRGFVDRLMEQLHCELYVGAGSGKPLILFAHDLQEWAMRDNVRAVALQDLLRLWANYLPPGSRCPTSLY